MPYKIKKTTATVGLFLILSFMIVIVPAVKFVRATPNTIVVPDDYSTIQAAINAASDGDTLFVKKGTYELPVNQTLVIYKTLSLMGEDAENTIINLHPAYNVTWILTAPFSTTQTQSLLLLTVSSFQVSRSIWHRLVGTSL